MPSLNFADAIAALTPAGGANPAFTLINEARAPSDYLWESFLPEQLRPNYDVKVGSMTVRATMAGMSGMDSPYAPVGTVETSTFNEQTAKITSSAVLNEVARRQLRMFAVAAGQGADEAVVRNNLLNFSDKLITQPHLDTMEFLRGQAFTGGALAWTSGNIRLSVDYGFPAANKLANRTSTARYGGSASVWWADYRAARSLLKGQVQAVIAHPDTIDQIISNSANNIIVTAQDLITGTVSFVKNVGVTATGPLIPSPDARDRTTIIGYGLEGDILDPANPGKTIGVSFCPRGKVVLIGRQVARGFTVGLGSASATPTSNLMLGYTHIGPTEEGDGALGRWARVYTPDERPWELRGEGVTNGLPVIEAYDRVVILSTDMS